MQLLTKDLIFTVYEKSSNNQAILDSLAELTREAWQDFEYPHETLPVDILKRRLKYQQRTDQISKHILMEDSNNNPLGYVTLYINTGKKNRSVCNTFFYIRKAFRKQGYFKLLFQKSLSVIPDYVTVFKFFFRVDDNQLNPQEKQSLAYKIESQMTELNAKLAFIGRRSDSDLTKFNLEQVNKKVEFLRKNAKENGYSIYFIDELSFSHVPFTRQEYVRLIEEVSNDMPRDNSTQDDSEFTEQDFLNWYKFAKDDKMTFWHFIAVDNQTNLPIAMTETRIFDFNPQLAQVGDTGVQRDHRGKKLGLTLKYLMLQKLLSESNVKTWITFNAKSNSHMLAINDELGYKQTSLEHVYEIPIENLKNYFFQNEFN